MEFNFIEFRIKNVTADSCIVRSFSSTAPPPPCHTHTQTSTRIRVHKKDTQQSSHTHTHIHTLIHTHTYIDTHTYIKHHIHTNIHIFIYHLIWITVNSFKISLTHTHALHTTQSCWKTDKSFHGYNQKFVKWKS